MNKYRCRYCFQIIESSHRYVCEACISDSSVLGNLQNGKWKSLVGKHARPGESWDAASHRIKSKVIRGDLDPSA